MNSRVTSKKRLWRSGIGLLTVLALLLVPVSLFAGGSAEVDGDEPVRLVFKALTWIKAEQDAQRELIDEWNANNPDIQVDLLPADWSTASQELLAGFETGDVPDIFHYAQPIIADWKNRGFLADLSPMLTDADLADVNDDVWAGLTSDDGEIIGVPIQYEVDVTYYNKDMFAQKGITPPTMDDPWTFDEMVEAARTLTDESAGVTGMAFPGLDHFGRVFTEVWAPKIGDPLVYTDDQGRYYLEVSDKSREFLRDMKRYLDEGVIPPEMLSPEAQNLGMDGLLQGKYAMIVGYGCWQRSMLLNEAVGMDAIDWGVAAPIQVNSTSIYGYIQTLSVPAASEHKEQAFEFLKWYWSPENVLKVAEVAFILPGRNSAVQSEELNTSEYSWDLVQEAGQYNVLPHYVLIPGWGQVTEGIGGTMFSEYFTGMKTLDEFIAKWERESTRILREANDQL